MVSEELFAELRKAGWRELQKTPNDKPLVYENFEAHNNWDFSSYNPTLKHLLASARVVDGIPFASLQEVRKWKVVSGRPKDFVDISLIDTYLER